MRHKNTARKNTLKKAELNLSLASTFSIFRMMTTIWYSVVLDTEIMNKLEIGLTSQLNLIHENIISNQIDQGPLGEIEDVKSQIRDFLLAVLDISINENSVHFLIHSNVVVDHVYEVFEDVVLEMSWKFIKRV